MTRRDPFQYEYTDKWRKGAQFNLSLRILEFFSWKNHIHMDGTKSQLQNAGWEFEIVMDKFCVQPFYYHHSEHALDGSGSIDEGRAASYPLIDRYGLRFVFYSKH